MQLNDPWKELYENWPARNEREVLALKLLSEARSEEIMAETQMSYKEYRDFMKWAKDYEVSKLCVIGPRKE